MTVSCLFGRVQAAGTSELPGGTAMIKSELVQRISQQNPHLYQRDVEHIVNPILNEITSALGAATASSSAASVRSR